MMRLGSWRGSESNGLLRGVEHFVATLVPGAHPVRIPREPTKKRVDAYSEWRGPESNGRLYDARRVLARPSLPIAPSLFTYLNLQVSPEPTNKRRVNLSDGGGPSRTDVLAVRIPRVLTKKRVGVYSEWGGARVKWAPPGIRVILEYNSQLGTHRVLPRLPSSLLSSLFPTVKARLELGPGVKRMLTMILDHDRAPSRTGTSCTPRATPSSLHKAHFPKFYTESGRFMFLERTQVQIHDAGPSRAAPLCCTETNGRLEWDTKLPAGDFWCLSIGHYFRKTSRTLERVYDLSGEMSQRGSQQEGESGGKAQSTRCHPHHNVKLNALAEAALRLCNSLLHLPSHALPRAYPALALPPLLVPLINVTLSHSDLVYMSSGCTTDRILRSFLSESFLSRMVQERDAEQARPHVNVTNPSPFLDVLLDDGGEQRRELHESRHSLHRQPSIPTYEVRINDYLESYRATGRPPPPCPPYPPDLPRAPPTASPRSSSRRRSPRWTSLNPASPSSAPARSPLCPDLLRPHCRPCPHSHKPASPFLLTPHKLFSAFLLPTSTKTPFPLHPATATAIPLCGFAGAGAALRHGHKPRRSADVPVRRRPTPTPGVSAERVRPAAPAEAEGSRFLYTQDDAEVEGTAIAIAAAITSKKATILQNQGLLVEANPIARSGALRRPRHSSPRLLTHTLWRTLASNARRVK
ncbi:hypothetical protein DFH09DRAFT_1095477 [Mycena vulgaris]|nr:hypothetical protein DFH09DRAFT_1095477 [Mycena vulgaris]